MESVLPAISVISGLRLTLTRQDQRQLYQNSGRRFFCLGVEDSGLDLLYCSCHLRVVEVV